MIIQCPADVLALPDDFDSQDLVSFNYRHFALWRNADALNKLEGHVSELSFPWSSQTRKDNFQTRLNHLPRYVLDAYDVVNHYIASDNCHIIACEADKFVCSVSLVAPLPQVVFHGLQTMPCPDIFDMPEMVNHDESPAAFVAAKRQRNNR